MRRFAWSMLALALLACRPGAIASEDEAAGTGSSGGADSSGSSSAGSSEQSSASETLDSSPELTEGPFPDAPNELPEGCSEVEFVDPEGEATGMWSGWLRCNDDFFRLEAIDCPTVMAYEACDPSEAECSECLDGESCLDAYGGSGYCFCGHNCTSDVDCGRGEICACRAEGLTYYNTCLPADCADELDCPAIDPLDVPHCRLSTDLCGSPESVHCRTELDACIFDQDCPNWWCRFDGVDMRWTCDQPAICE